jgi:antirestriction protein
MQTTSKDTPKIYVGTYHKYSSGSIAGKWMELDDYADKSEFYEACAKLHKDERDPEFMFQDYENIPEGMVSECSVDEKVWSEWIPLDDGERLILELYQAGTGYSDATYEKASDRYHGAHDSVSAYAEHYYEECYSEEMAQIPQGISIDWEHTWNGYLRMDLFEVRHEGESHIFSHY